MRESLALKLPAATIPGSLPFSLYPSSERFMQSLSDIIPAHSSGPFHAVARRQQSSCLVTRAQPQNLRKCYGATMACKGCGGHLISVYRKRRPRKLLIHVNNLGLGPCSSSTRYFLVSELTQKRSGRNFAL